MKRAIWISYDLGIQGDYEGIYQWLDKNKAIECGDSLAFITYECSKEVDILSELKSDIEQFVEKNSKTRIYIIYRDSKTTKMKGHFIFGGRKAAPWTGYYIDTNHLETSDVEE